jgi:hypothetical protein
MVTTIELIYFDGCPHAAAARENLRVALEGEHLPGEWQEWNQHSPGTPAHAKQYGSPTVLVDGRDVTGQGAGVAASACRADGAPAVQTISAALAAG